MIFSKQKNGYNKDEVDNFIEMLKNDYEDRLAKQKDRIFELKQENETIKTGEASMDDLVSVVEKARQIESSSKSIFELENRKLKIIINRLEGLAKRVEKCLSNDERVSIISEIEGLKSVIDHICSTNSENIDSINPVRRLLAKMHMSTSEEKEEQKAPGTEEALAPEASTLKVGDFKFVRKSVKKQDVPEGRFDNFLNEESDLTNFEKIMFNGKKRKNIITDKPGYPTPNASGFDLKEAVNPKDDLNEIMKAFDFFGGDKK